MADDGGMVGVDKSGVGRSGLEICLVGVGLGLVTGVVGAGVGSVVVSEQPVRNKAINRREGRQFFIKFQVQNKFLMMITIHH
jgi:hypothetical protein